MGLCQAIFTRRGGVSPEPWAALNLGSTVGDSTSRRVRENRRRVLAAVGRDTKIGVDVWQVHGVNVVIADAPRPADAPHIKADVILTNNPGITVMMRFADCVPILLHDPVRKVVGIAHAGWMGTVKGTVRFASGGDAATIWIKFKRYTGRNRSIHWTRPLRGWTGGRGASKANFSG